jgi:hypothetical protein
MRRPADVSPPGGHGSPGFDDDALRRAAAERLGHVHFLGAWGGRGEVTGSGASTM